MNNTKNINILFWNCNGIQNKALELQTFLKTNKIDIALLGKILTNSNKSIKFHNYFTYRQDRPTNPTGPQSGGTAILVGINIVHQHILIPTTVNTTSIKIKLGSDQVQIFSVYKSPNAILLQSDLEALTNQGGPFIITGDLKTKYTSS